MSALRLMDRLTDLDLTDDQLRIKQASDRLLISLQQHLGRLLNTRRGSVLVDEQYGVPDFSSGPGNSTLPNAETMGQVILEVIHHYEQRLKSPKVELLLNSADNLSIDVSISGKIKHKEEVRDIRLNGVILANGSFEFEAIE